MKALLLLARSRHMIEPALATKVVPKEVPCTGPRSGPLNLFVFVGSAFTQKELAFQMDAQFAIIGDEK